MDGTKKACKSTIGTAKPTPLIGDTTICRDGGSMEPNQIDSYRTNGGSMNRRYHDHEPTERELMELITNNFMSKAVIGKVIGYSSSTAWRRMKDEKIVSLREMDEAYMKRAQLYNEDIPRELVTHAMDFYRWSNGSLQRMHHGRLNVKIDGKPIMMGILTNIKTGKVWYSVFTDDIETTIKGMTVIQNALDDGEEVEYLQMDRVLRELMNGLEEINITPICYGKTAKHPYNSYAEGVFREISKVLYLNMGVGYGHYTKAYGKGRTADEVKYYRKLLSRNILDGLTHAEAVEYFKAIVEINFYGNAKPLWNWTQQQKRQTIEAIQTQPTQTKREKDAI